MSPIRRDARVSDEEPARLLMHRGRALVRVVRLGKGLVMVVLRVVWVMVLHRSNDRKEAEEEGRQRGNLDELAWSCFPWRSSR
jgi:hypothetical protein